MGIIVVREKRAFGSYTLMGIIAGREKLTPILIRVHLVPKVLFAVVEDIRRGVVTGGAGAAV